MDEYTLSQYALILSIQDQIDGMKAANQQCDLSNITPVYNETCFTGYANDMNDSLFVLEDFLDTEINPINKLLISI